MIHRNMTHPRKAAALAFFVALFPLLMIGPLLAAPAAPESAAAVNQIYWTDQQASGQTGEIWRSAGDGSLLERLVDGLGNPRGIELDTNASRMYWVDRITDTIGRASLDGTNQTKSFCSGLSNPDDLALDIANGKMYWTEPTDNRIRWSSLNSCNPQTFLSATSGVADPVGIALDLKNGKVYWTEFSPARVKRANLNGTNIETLINSGLWSPLELALDVNDGYMYITDSIEDTPGYGGRIVRATLSGENLITIVPNLDNPRGIALDLEDNHLYWIDFGTSKLQRSDLSGSNIIAIKSGGDSLTFARSLTLYQGPAVPCYNLSLFHTGNGSDPTAAPSNSTGCPAKQYSPGTVISLSAFPDTNWKVGSWSGTDNNSSTSNNNTVTMPNSARTVTVNYVQQITCYTLSLQHTGSGGDPQASPSNSTGCPDGQYTAGATISLTASPASDSVVEGWSGTNNNASTSTSNTVTMPGANHTVIVHYKGRIDCYTLLLQHTGQGNDPIPSPPSSADCPIGQYKSGDVINLTADPAPSWTVKNWSGTANNNSTSTTNNAIMPNGTHTVIVNYGPPACYQLVLTNEGPGTPPVATPANSSGCGAGQYLPGTAIVLTATPSSGTELIGWIGTIDNSSTSQTNIVVMPAAIHQAGVRYRLIPVFTQHNYLPGTMTSPPDSGPTCYTGEREIEPNNTRDIARENGVFCLGRTYSGLPTDDWDTFAFDVDAGTLTALVNNHRGPNVVLIIADSNGKPLANDSNAADGLQASYRVPSPGRYFISLFVAEPNANETTDYTMRVTKN